MKVIVPTEPRQTGMLLIPAGLGDPELVLGLLVSLQLAAVEPIVDDCVAVAVATFLRSGHAEC
jgi:hypothetical protein